MPTGMFEAAFQTAFTLWGTPSTWLEVVAFVFALGMVWCNLRVIHWGWPLGIAASALYGLLFARYGLYGEAGLQALFVLVSIWGWSIWLLGRGHPIREVRSLQPRERFRALTAGAVCVASVGLLLTNFTDSNVPWLDATPTGLSILGQWLLARKRTDNWLVWIIVNLISCSLFAYKGLWLTVILYGIFAILSVVGWRAWLELERVKHVSVLR